MTEHFLNPYNFVTLTPRPTGDHELADGRPPGHDRYRPGLWSGSIPITITTVTPLLIPDHTDAASRQRDDNKATPPLSVRRDAQGRPLLVPSSVKGMLRSAYEAVTNSRLGVFDGDRKLAIRAGTRDALGLCPAVVTTDGQGGHLVRWVESLRPSADATLRPQTAVWVPIKLLGDLPHGAVVQARMHLMHWQDGNRRAHVWRVSEIAPHGSGLSMTTTDDGLRSRKLSPTSCPPVHVRGILHRTDSKFPAEPDGRRKHDERLVVTAVLDGNAEVRHRCAPVTPELERAWQAVIVSYTHAHATEERNAEFGRKYGTYVTKPDHWLKLSSGSTCYVELKDGQVVALLPAMIGRRPFPGVPKDNVPHEHRPASTLDELSPADRVFGWVRTTQGSSTGNAHRGHLRVEPGPDQPSSATIRQLDRPLPLTTLNSPKSEQFLFYLGDADGKPLEGSATRKQPTNGYGAHTGGRPNQIRGRKVYLTHRKAMGPEYWDPDGRDLPTGHREYRHPDPGKSSVITTVDEWVEPGAEFTFTLRVENLRPMELGALLWLLGLAPDEHHKVGLAKPLGFGVVRVEPDLSQARLYPGEAMRARYASLTAVPAPATSDELSALCAAFAADPHTRQARTQFRAAARGFDDLPVHYPRETNQPVAETYQWWVTNDRAGNERQTLPALSDSQPPKLPYQLPENPRGKPGSARQQPGRGRKPYRPR